ncbi:MAG TPA: ABC transporter permease [Polyangiaceae bacterium]|jgi:NitT/TauT family transport system permease protein|nr:ABC transporter permease [Polyangiaceae bacterium]
MTEPSPRATASRELLSSALPPALTFVLVIALWEGVVRVFSVPRFLVPPPSDVLLATWSERASLSGALLTTAQGAVLGFLLSASLGTTVGLAFSLSRWLERGLYPYALFLQTVPIVAVAPLLVLWFGPGLRAVAVSAFIVSVFPIIANTLAGLRSVDPRLSDLFRLYGANLGDTVLKLRLPTAIPSMMTGLKVASGLSVIGAIVGEFVAGFSEGNAGLGITVLAAYRQLRTDLLFAAVLLASLLGLLLFALVNGLSTLLLRRLRAPS